MAHKLNVKRVLFAVFTLGCVLGFIFGRKGFVILIPAFRIIIPVLAVYGLIKLLKGKSHSR